VIEEEGEDENEYEISWNRRSNKKGKKKNTKLRRNIEDGKSDENNSDDNDSKPDNDIAYSNVIMVNSSENVKDDNNTTKREKCKKKTIKTKYDVEGSEDEDVDRRTPQEKVNDSRAELFRARSTDELRPTEENNTTSKKVKKKKKLKMKAKKKKQTADQIDDDDDNDEENGEGERNARKKKKKKKNKTDPNGRGHFTDSSSNDALYNGAGMQPSSFNGKLPPIRENGHTSKLQPIDLRGREFCFHSRSFVTGFKTWKTWKKGCFSKKSGKPGKGRESCKEISLVNFFLTHIFFIVLKLMICINYNCWLLA